MGSLRPQPTRRKQLQRQRTVQHLASQSSIYRPRIIPLLSCSFCSLRCAFLRSFSIIGAERPIAVCAWHNLNLVERFRERVEPVCLQCKFEHFSHFLHGRVVANNLKRSRNRSNNPLAFETKIIQVSVEKLLMGAVQEIKRQATTS